MSNRTLSLILGGYVLLCIVVGGSAQGRWANLALQLLGIALLGLAALNEAEREPPDRSQMLIAGLLIAGLAFVLVQLVPLPASLWTSLPGREALQEGFRTLGYPAPAMPISEAPYTSLLTLFSAIPAIAAFVVVMRLRPDPRWVAQAVVAATILAILFGAIQVSSGANSWAYLYKINSAGAVGFFANRNHMATLLLVAIPMAAALLASAKSDRRSAAGRYATAGALVVTLMVGIGLNQSFAAYGLALPVLFASFALLPATAGWRRIALPVAAVAMFGGIVLLASKPIGTTAIQASATVSVTSRAEIWNTTGKAIAETFPAGTGLGTFQQVYSHYEDPSLVTNQYVNHAHNDYLELVLELGVVGMALIILFLAWWVVAAARIWTSPLSTPYSRAATIVTATILAHSVVDFPLRTAAISAIFAVSVAIMAQHLASAPAPRKGESRPTRHVKLG
jgi:O-antigen ligase